MIRTLGCLPALIRLPFHRSAPGTHSEWNDLRHTPLWAGAKKLDATTTRYQKDGSGAPRSMPGSASGYSISSRSRLRCCSAANSPVMRRPRVG